MHYACIDKLILLLILFLIPKVSLSLYFQTDKLVFGCVDANFGDIKLSIVHCTWITASSPFLFDCISYCFRFTLSYLHCWNKENTLMTDTCFRYKKICVIPSLVDGVKKWNGILSYTKTIPFLIREGLCHRPNHICDTMIASLYKNINSFLNWLRERYPIKVLSNHCRSRLSALF